MSAESKCIHNGGMMSGSSWYPQKLCML